MADKSGRITVEVAYALPERQTLASVELPAGATAERAIRQSGLLEEYPEIDLAANTVGIFGRRCRLDTVIEDGDRVEIYRPLRVDPREARRQLAAEGRTMGRDED